MTDVLPDQPQPFHHNSFRHNIGELLGVLLKWEYILFPY